MKTLLEGAVLYPIFLDNSCNLEFLEMDLFFLEPENEWWIVFWRYTDKLTEEAWINGDDVLYFSWACLASSFTWVFWRSSETSSLDFVLLFSFEFLTFKPKLRRELRFLSGLFVLGCNLFDRFLFFVVLLATTFFFGWLTLFILVFIPYFLSLWVFSFRSFLIFFIVSSISELGRYYV